MPLPSLAKRAGSFVHDRILDESIRLAGFLKRRIGFFLSIWAGLAVLGGFMRISVLAYMAPQAFETRSLLLYALPYLVIAVAPAVGWFLATRAWPDSAAATQPELRLAKFGQWHNLPAEQARRNKDFGVAGFLTSLSAGLLISMVLRLGEYLLAIPAMPPYAPQWGFQLYDLMTFDIILLSFLYFTCFTMALRAAPLFPRMLLLTWLYDLVMQVTIGNQMTAASGVPAVVLDPLLQVLSSNSQKVLISMAIWLPYLILSKRVNLTFRHRVQKAPAIATR
jgi:hypothetical protein